MNYFPINDFLSGILSIDPNIITYLAISACIGLAIWAWRVERIRDVAPSLMVSAGIIGTFWGTFIALAGFHTGSDVNY